MKRDKKEEIMRRILNRFSIPQLRSRGSDKLIYTYSLLFPSLTQVKNTLNNTQ